jgi:tetratricopeptide (TPR) repeat protein
VRGAKRLESDLRLIRELGLVRERGVVRVESPNPDLRRLELPLLRELAARWDLTNRSFTGKLISLVRAGIEELPIGLARAAAVRMYGLDCDPTFPRPSQWRGEARNMYPLLSADDWRKGMELEILGLIAANIRALTAGVPDPRSETDQSLGLDSWKSTCTLLRSVPLVGRSAELSLISDALRTAGGADQVMPVCVLHGMAGVGKTALAVAAAHSLAAAFPDGQLYLNMHGFTPDREPLSPLDALGRLLRQVAVSTAAVPVDLDERASMWRDKLSHRRVLVVLDNVVSGSQVESLLPGAPTCAVILTSRRHLGGVDHASDIHVSHLGEESAVELLRSRLAGGSRPGNAVLARVSKACAHLPLALHIVASYLQRRPGMSVEIAENLESSPAYRARIVDRDGSVSKALSASYHQVDPVAQKVLRLSSVLPGVTVTPGKVAATCRMDEDIAESTLERLFENHLMENLSPGVYQLHDIVRDYLRNLTLTGPAAVDIDTCLADVARYYQERLTEFVPILYGSPGSAPVAELTPGSLEKSVVARSWIECEREAIIATIKALAERGLAAQVAGLARLLAKDLLVKGYFKHAKNIHALAMDCRDDPVSQVVAQENLGTVHLETGNFPGALRYFHAARDSYLRHGDKSAAARVLDRIGFTYERTGHYAAAERALTQAMTYLDEEDSSAAGTALNTLGAVRWRQANYDGALECFWRALRIRRSVGDHFGAARTLNNIGFTFQRLGRHVRALAFLRHAWRLAVHHGDMNTYATVMNNFGYTLCDMGEAEAGLSFARGGLDVARKIGSRYEEARALDAIGLSLHAIGDQRRAVASWRMSLRIFHQLNVPEAALVRGRVEDA